MKFIKSYIDSLPSVDWILNESNLPWLKLDIDIPVYEIYEEWEKVSHLAVEHRSTDELYNLKNVGWKSLTIYGVASNITHASDGLHDWTEIANNCPTTVQWIKDNFIINEDTRRIRFMLLEPGGYILPHYDREKSGLSEINVAIKQPESCYFKFKNYGVIPFGNGDSFIIDTSKEHAVYNNSQLPRLHIILHTQINKEVIKKSYGISYNNTQ